MYKKIILAVIITSITITSAILCYKHYSEQKSALSYYKNKRYIASTKKTLPYNIGPIYATRYVTNKKTNNVEELTNSMPIEIGYIDSNSIVLGHFKEVYTFKKIKIYRAKAEFDSVPLHYIKCKRNNEDYEIIIETVLRGPSDYIMYIYKDKKPHLIICYLDFHLREIKKQLDI